MQSLIRSVLAAGMVIGQLALALPAVAAEEAPAAQAAGLTADYKIGPGDMIQVFVWRNPDLTVTVPVKPDGRITTPLVENMTAAGKTTDQLARDIEAVLGQYIRTPQVNIIVTAPQSVFNQIRVVGQLRNQQAVHYREGLTVLDVVLAAGGLTEFAAGNRARIIREQDGTRKEIKVKLKNLIEKGDMRANVSMLPGDVLIVPESRF